MTILWFSAFTPALLALTAGAVLRGGTACRSYGLAWCGLAATMIGDYFLAVKGARLDSADFLRGVAGFSLAHLFWIAFLRIHAAWNPRVAFGLLLSLGALFVARVLPVLASARLAWALAGYALLSIISVSYAFGRHRLSAAWRYGLAALLTSDVLIAFGRILHVPRVGRLVGVTYVAALLLIAAAIMRCARCPRPHTRLDELRRAPGAVFWGGIAVLILFLAAMTLYPERVYNPGREMLSKLGRTRLRGVDYPLCHYLFTAGLTVSAWAIARFYPALACLVKGTRNKAWLLWGGVLNVSGLLVIACVPENVHVQYHNLGCVAAVGGGAWMLLLLSVGGAKPYVSAPVRWGWFAWCIVLVTLFEAFLLAHRFRVLPFAPYVPTCQKALIITFAAWLMFHAFILRRLTRVRRKDRPHITLASRSGSSRDS